MKNSFKILVASAIALQVFACINTDKKGVSVETESKTKGSASLSEKRSYSVDTSSSEITWTAYKFTQKLGVNGTFNHSIIRAESKNPSLEELLEGAEIDIVTKSVNSNNEGRDAKLRTYFFEVFNTDTITGSITNATEGKGTMQLKMNNISNNTQYTYAIVNDTLLLTTDIDLTFWEAKTALATLNKECLEVHTGADGISKLWPDVSISFKIPLVYD